MEGVTDLEAPGDDFQYQVKLRCNSCSEVSEKWQFISADEKIEMQGSRGVCNYQAKCKLCNRISSLDVCLQQKGKYTADDVPNFKTVIAFECRGLSICDFQFGEGWKCKGVESKTVFENLDLSEDWCDYDEEAKEPVGISELEFNIT
ncbi:hypothetical protein Avbf_01247 [Armadillidium vulgare]|nr:hypothetical protein Avbf_01247 [Armadillidium vulgare]